MPVVILSLILHLAAHEIGHMMAGAVTGWRLIYLQISRIAFVKENDRFRLKTVPTYGCRCIMYPTELHRNASFYTLGGVFMNLLLTAAGVAGVSQYFNRPSILIYAFGLIAFGILFLTTNGIPNIGRVCNDMACFQIIKNDITSMKSHNFQMIIAHRLFEGKTYRQIDQNLIVVGDARINNDILAYHAVLEYYYHLDRDAYMPAQGALDKIEMEAPISQEVRNIINMELLYMDFVMDFLNKKNTTENNKRYTEGIDNFIKDHKIKGDIHSIRVKTASEAYNNYVKGNLDLAIKCLEKGIKDIEGMKYLYLGEKFFCIDQLMGIKSMLLRDSLTEEKTGTDN